MAELGKVALLWRGDSAKWQNATPETSRLVRIFEALAASGVTAEPCVYAEERTEAVRAQLLKCRGVLVWVDPLSDGKTRKELDPLLREIAGNGVWVSAHPDVILKMGVKEVLVRTKALGWGTDTHLYRSATALNEEFPRRVRAAGPRVLKRNRGNGGQGVWKVEAIADERVRVLHAQRGSVLEELPLAQFLARCAEYFSENGCVVDQPFQPRLPDGMIRCYMGADKVVGFGHQLIKALIAPPPEGPDSPEAQPGPRIMHGPEAFPALREQMETSWVPQMTKLLAMERRDLPIIWDADFLYGPRDAKGNDTHVLCEINVSSVFPIPDQAPAEIARLVSERLRAA